MAILIIRLFCLVLFPTLAMTPTTRTIYCGPVAHIPEISSFPNLKTRNSSFCFCFLNSSHNLCTCIEIKNNFGMQCHAWKALQRKNVADLPQRFSLLAIGSRFFGSLLLAISFLCPSKFVHGILLDTQSSSDIHIKEFGAPAAPSWSFGCLDFKANATLDTATKRKMSNTWVLSVSVAMANSFKICLHAWDKALIVSMSISLMTFCNGKCMRGSRRSDLSHIIQHDPKA